MVSTLTESNMSKTFKKRRTFESTVHHRSCCFPPNFKRPKVDTMQQLPIGCRRNNQRKGEENPIAIAAAGNSQASLLENAVQGSEEDTIATVATENLQPSENSARARHIDMVTSLVPASIESPILKTSEERPYESTVCHQGRGFPLNFKRPKVDAIREFPSGCGALAPRIYQRKTEDPITAVAIGNLQAAVKPLENVVQAKESDSLGSFGSISQPRLPITAVLPPQIEQRRSEKDPIAFVPDGNSLAPVKPLEENPIAIAAAGNSQASLLENAVQGSEEDTIATVATENLQPSENSARARHIDMVTSLVPASIESPILKTSEERPYESTVCHQGRGFPLNFKRPKVDAIREFPSGCGALAPRINQRKTEDPITAVALGNLQAAVKPLENVVQAKESDSLSSFGSIAQPRLPITAVLPPQIEQRRSEKDPIAFVPDGNSLAPVNPLEKAAEDFPTGVGSTNPVSCSKNSILAKGKSYAETGHKEATIITDAKLFLGKIKCRDALKSSSNKHAREECGKNIVGQELNDPTVVSAEDYHRRKVREALDLFEELYTKLSDEQKAKSKVEKIASSRIPKMTAMILKKQHKWVNTSKKFGAISGIEIGDSFHFRAELAIVGLHGPFVGGIDYMEKDGKLLTTSIVASDRYANYMGSPDVLIYCGQGGNPAVGDMRIEDQKLEGGNLALFNSMVEKNLVRVIRGVKDLKTTIYIYDGFYIVDKYWKEIGEYGKQVFKFQLKRVPGQPEVPWRILPRQYELHRSIVNKSKKNEIRKRHCVLDISQGKEKMPIPAVNIIDDEKPPSFNYITKMIYPKCYNRRSMPSGCVCTDGCLNAKKCSCALKNGGEIPFNVNGTIVKGKPLVYECGPSCKCSSSCSNRVSQQGIRFSLEIFKTKSKRWGVRSRNYIPSGSFICEYIGELLKNKVVEGRTSDEEAYLFELRDYDNDNISGCFTIDAAQFGNVGRFINHSCSPNLHVQKVLYDHGDKTAPHIMLFATKNIPPRTELLTRIIYWFTY